MPLTPGGIYIMRIQDEKKFSKIFKYMYIYIYIGSGCSRVV